MGEIKNQIKQSEESTEIDKLLQRSARIKAAHKQSVEQFEELKKETDDFLDLHGNSGKSRINQSLPEQGEDN